MFEMVTLHDNAEVPAIVFSDTRILFVPDEDIHPDDPQGFFATSNGALMIDESNPRKYKSWLKQIMSGISDSQRYKGLPMRRIAGTDSHGNRYAVVVVGDSDNEHFQNLADEWAGYFSGHSYRIVVQDKKNVLDQYVWTRRESDTVRTFFGDPTAEPYNSKAIVAAYEEYNL